MSAGFAMLHDIVRAALVVAVLSASAAILLETRERFAVIDAAARLMAAQHSHQVPMPVYPPYSQPQPGRLQSLGRAMTDLADAALAIVR
jgi:hypothetical protein